VLRVADDGTILLTNNYRCQGIGCLHVDDVFPILETARTSLADIANSKDMNKKDLQDRARVAYEEIVQNHRD
jgi:hypothetical protein